MSEFFDKSAETASQDQITALQSEKLRQTVKYVYENNALYREKFDRAGIVPAEFKGLEDIAKLPMLTKSDFQDSYPLGYCCVDKRQLVEMHMSSGSTGTPVVMPYTREDLLQWGHCMARCYRMAGIEQGDVLQITPSFGLFNGGFGFYHGAQSLGLFVVPTGAGNTPRQIKLAKDFKTRAITGVVSYGLRLIEVLEEENQQLEDLEIGIFGAETFSDSLKKKVSQGLGAEVFDIYGMTETGGVGTLGQDCKAHDGFHVWQDHYIVEILDRETHKPVPDGQLGELVITSLTRKALPVIRFKTGDLTRVISRDKCSCGRTHLRIESVTGRADDMLIVKGVNFFPRQVEQALMEIPGVGTNYQIIIEDIDGVRDVRINVEADESVTGYMVEKHLKERLNFSPKGDVFKPGQLERQPGKAKRVFYRNK